MRINFYEDGNPTAIFGYEGEAPPPTSMVIDLENYTPLDILGMVPRKSERRQYLVTRVRMSVSIDTRWDDGQVSYHVFMKRIDTGEVHE
jgi:hypothetical protein